MRTTMMIVAVTVVLGAGGASALLAQKPRRASPTLLPGGSAPPAPAAAPASRPDSARTKGTRPSPTLVGGTPASADSSRAPARGAAAPAVAAQAARSNAPGRATAFTAGLAIEPYGGESDQERDRYAAQFTLQLDSAIALLVSVFRGTTGQPVAGAAAPAELSQRERDRWGRCRDLHFDVQSYTAALGDFLEQLPDDPPVQRAGAALDSALTALRATAACDDVSSMIAAPDRWTPWASQYQSTARDFYRDWYPQVREVADRNRALVIALNAVLPAAARIAVPPGLSRTPPYAGAGPR